MLSAIRVPSRTFFEDGPLTGTMTLLLEQDRRLEDGIDVTNTKKRRLDALKAIRDYALAIAATGELPRITLGESCESALVCDGAIPSFVYPGTVTEYLSTDGRMVCRCKTENHQCEFNSFLSEALEAQDAIVFCIERPWDVN